MRIPELRAQAQADVRTWLRNESDYQFAKNFRTHKADADRSLQYIVTSEIPNKWHRFHLFQSAWKTATEIPLQIQASRQLLKVTAAARAAFVWGQVVEGRNFDNADLESWDRLATYRQDIATRRAELPSPDVLYQVECPVETNVPQDTDELAQRFTYLSGLAVTQLLHAEEQSKLYVMPPAGVPS